MVIATGLQQEKSTYLEQLEGYAAILMDYVKLQDADGSIMIWNFGRNAVPVEMAVEAKEGGHSVVAVSSVDQPERSSPRNRIGKRLDEAADVVLDTRTKPGEKE